MNAPTFDLVTLLDWSEPRTVSTRKGERVLRTAAPDGQFWTAWRDEPVKAEMREAGISVGKRDGAWEVCWWSEVPVERRALTERQTASTLSERNRASRESATAGFVMPPIEHRSETIFNAGRSRRSAPEVAFAPARESSASVVQSSDGNGSSNSQVKQDSTTAEAYDGAVVRRPQLDAQRCGRANSLPSGVKWSTEHQAIFAWFKSGTGNLVVQARAGTGKTTTIKEAFSYAPEQQMLYAVFNKKNQREAVAKITDPRVEVKTLHSLGFSFIKSVWRDAQPDDNVEQDRIEAACRNIHDEAVTTVARLVGFAKNLFTGVPTEAQLVEVANDRGVFCGVQTEEGEDEYPAERLASIAKQAMELSKERDGANRISFDDMVWLPVAMHWVRPRYDLVCIDEAQDMNLPQLLMARHSVRKGGRVCVVGDDRQAIYGFRGAAQDGMEMMRRELDAETLGLTTTYRCPKLVVAMAAQIVPDYKAAPEAPDGEVLHCNEGDLAERLTVGDAVLSRLNAPLMGICLGLLRKGVSARIEGRDIGKQLCGVVRKLKAKSVPDFMRRLCSWADKQKARLDVGKNGKAKCAVVEDQVQTLQAVAEGCANVAEIESRLLSLFQDSDENAKPAVVLSSVHKAKGLEWERTALLAWTFCRGRRGMTPEQEQEEKNIHYVALTRSKRLLTLVSEGGRTNTIKPVEGEAKAGAA